MMADKSKYLVTEEGLAEIKAELEKLYEDRKLIVEQIKEAKSYGDLSENSEYSEVKDRQQMLEKRIAELEDYAKNAVVDTKVCRNGEVCVGSEVTVEMGNKTFNYTIVGATQADPTSGKISVESPVGKSLIGRKKGEEITVCAPKGKITMQIMDVA